MSQTAEVLDDRQERSSALDRFARADEGRPRHEITIPSQALTGGNDRIIGAQQVAVYRDETRVLSKLRQLAAAAGTDWFYRYPVQNRKQQRTDWIEGPSIKLANDLARIYGNCLVDTRVMDLGDSWLIYANFTDFETGFSLTRPFQQRKNASKLGGEDDARRLDIALQIGASKAIRNVVVNALQTFADFAFDEARGALVDKIGARLDQYRTKVVERLGEMQVDLKRVELIRGRPVDGWLAPDVARTIAEIQAVKDGMASADETWPAPAADAAEAEQETGTPAASAALDQFAAAVAADAKEGAAAKAPAEAAAEQERATPAAAAATETAQAAAGGGGDAVPANETQIEIATRRGREAYRAGMARKAVPPELRTDDRAEELKAWQAGYDAEKKAAAPKEGGLDV